MIAQTTTQSDEELLCDLRARSYYGSEDIEELCMRLANALDYISDLEGDLIEKLVG